MLTNILVPALGLILLTFVIGLIHTIASVNLMGKGKDWEESGIPVEPYKDAPLHLKIIKLILTHKKQLVLDLQDHITHLLLLVLEHRQFRL